MIVDQFDSMYLIDLHEDQISTLSDMGLGCKKNNIMDPLTRRCILISGQVGQKIIQMLKANDDSLDEYSYASVY